MPAAAASSCDGGSVTKLHDSRPAPSIATRRSSQASIASGIAAPSRHTQTKARSATAPVRGAVRSMGWRMGTSSDQARALARRRRDSRWLMTFMMSVITNSIAATAKMVW
jgi:hypothetical protein